MPLEHLAAGPRALELRAEPPVAARPGLGDLRLGDRDIELRVLQRGACWTASWSSPGSVDALGSPAHWSDRLLLGRCARRRCRHRHPHRREPGTRHRRARKPATPPRSKQIIHRCIETARIMARGFLARIVRHACDACDSLRTRRAFPRNPFSVSVPAKGWLNGTSYVLLPRRASAAAGDVHRQDRARILAGAVSGFAVGRDRAGHRDQPGHRRRAQGDAGPARRAGRRARLRPARGPRSRQGRGAVGRRDDPQAPRRRRGRSGSSPRC